MDPITILPEDLHSFILPHSAQALLPLMKVNSKWKIAVKNVLHKYFFSEYVPSGENLETYPSKYCVGSTKELKERIQQFFEQVENEKAVFICLFPFNTSVSILDSEIPAFLAIKWNPDGRTNFFNNHSDGFKYDHSKISPYILSRSQRDGVFSSYFKGRLDPTNKYIDLENKTSKLALKICFSTKKLKEHPKVDSIENDVEIDNTHIETTIRGCSIMFDVGRDGHFCSRDVRLIKQIKSLASSEMNRPYRIFLYMVIWSVFAAGPIYKFTERYDSIIKWPLLITITFIFMRIIILVESRIKNF